MTNALSHNADCPAPPATLDFSPEYQAEVQFQSYRETLFSAGSSPAPAITSGGVAQDGRGAAPRNTSSDSHSNLSIHHRTPNRAPAAEDSQGREFESPPLLQYEAVAQMAEHGYFNVSGRLKRVGACKSVVNQNPEAGQASGFAFLCSLTLAC